MTAYRQDISQDALRAYHLRRVTSQFKTTISAENALRLARLLALDDGTADTRKD
ncbi:MAG: hypothetical protein JOY82_01170 [Streptosporangiaceae bacterium]|nr:hypothetical protein [Streptosporangiaceae bacterium]